MTKKKPEPIDMSWMNKDNSQKSNEPPTSTGAIYFLTPEELAFHIKNGESGNKKSAIKVLNYYMFSNLNEELKVYWMKKAAELGDTPSQFNYALYLSEKGEIGEAIKWAKKAASSGDSSAHEFIKRLKSSP